MSSDLLVELLQALDAPQARYCELENYYAGTQALAYLSADARSALDNRFGRMVSNIPRLAVNSLAERLRITGFTGADVWADWLRLDLDQLATVSHREALLYGSAFAIVWADGQGRPLVSIESARQVQVRRDPGTREVVAAVKRWRTTTHTYAVVYLPDRIERWTANTPGAATAGFDLVETIANPLGVVPVVELKNVDRLPIMASTAPQMFELGLSEIDDLKPLVDGLAKILTDMMVTSEYVGRPRRWATGIDLVEIEVVDSEGNPTGETRAVNPIPEGDRAMVSENDQAQFGQLGAADLRGYETAVQVILGQIMAVSALPAHYVGIFTDNPASADALRASEAGITARAENRQAVFGRGWERVARLMVAIRDNVDVADVSVRVHWADASTRSTAQEADATLKLVQAGVLSKSGALRRLGFTEDEIVRELADQERDAEASADPNLGRYFKNQNK
ncbi:Phage portal protein, SPP1 Gp6 [Mycobacteroides abscessus subsp. abscessus]|uniref:Phage portal protein, SPP1 Gp6 n=1 Tax=Mycobacteroides abscessus TaxID=36809 RepID=A0AB33SYS1_9MYCO|nr:phage portal protein [Mycobacteroides abscessus]MDO3015308.1 phage portal protein [Mycobacteroides abscessus subsp. abscessus]MDO3085861.1 phage portal protein [Mycobacteroides abscessus subsp. abscessus]MDO3315768.1 phage portal protein [Mycobacteroides abscessus subsp. abscessus]MDO3343051.1 phage portal protein [Mycobacteroides abscessus subsp. abscessus]PVB17164.1 phage portal protein [Mycobacteroides abscessus]